MRNNENRHAESDYRHAIDREFVLSLGIEHKQDTPALRMLLGSCIVHPGLDLICPIGKNHKWTDHHQQEGITGVRVAKGTKILRELDLIITTPGIKGVSYSTIRATAKLIAAQDNWNKNKEINHEMSYIGQPYVVSRSDTGESTMVHDARTPWAREDIQLLRRHADLVLESHIHTDHSDSHVHRLDLVRGDGNRCVVPPEWFVLHRSYRADGEDKRAHGGRLWCRAHGELRGREGQRLDMTIGGRPVVEIDIVAAQPRILFASAGIDLGDRDIYTEIAPNNRAVGKAVVMYLIGSTKPTYAGLRSCAAAQPHLNMIDRELWDRVREIFAPVWSDLGEAWRVTQKAESDWLAATMRAYYDLAGDDPLLPWHDSVVCVEDDADLVLEIAQEQWSRLFDLPGDHVFRVEGQ